MAALSWDEAGKRFGETGTDKGVIYRKDNTGKYKIAQAWDGLTGVSTEPEGGEANDNYADNITNFWAASWGVRSAPPGWPPTAGRCWTT